MSQLVERMQHFVIPLSAANLNPVEGISLKVDLDAPFLLRGIVVWNLNVAGGQGVDGQLAIRFARPDGRLIQRQLTSSNLLAPGNQYNGSGLSPTKALAAPIRPGVLYPAGSVIQVDVMGLNTGIVGPTGVVVVFVGTNLYRQGTIWAPGYPSKWTAIPYLDNVTVQNLAVPGGLPSLNNAFTAQADSDFVWQAGVYTDLSVAGARAFLNIINDETFNFILTAVAPGVGGNSISFEIIDAGPSQPFSMTVIGNAISVTLQTDTFGVHQSIGSLITAMRAVPAFNALVTVTPVGGLIFPATAFPVAFLAGGSGGGSGTLDQLVDLGVIIRDPSYKAYSNDYVPVALLFPFLGAQNPGWLYPEIYVPRLAQLYFDFNYLYPGFTPASPITVTLGLKGMKVYAQ